MPALQAGFLPCYGFALAALSGERLSCCQNASRFTERGGPARIEEGPATTSLHSVE